MGNPVADPKPAQAAVIRRAEATGETAHERLVRKHIPAWVASGAVHVALVGGLLAADTLMAKPAQGPMSTAELTVVTDDKPPEEPKEDLTNQFVGLDPDLIPAIEAPKLDDVNVQDKLVTKDPPGLEEATKDVPIDFVPPPGLKSSDLTDPGTLGKTGDFKEGTGGGDGAIVGEAFRGRGAATRSRLVALNGGNGKSEAAVGRGLVWLAKQQKPNGSWMYDGISRTDTIAATGMALLPFLAAGQTHKSSKDNKYNKTVEAGLKYLISQQTPAGGFRGVEGLAGMYSHAIAAMALCEAFGMSGDKGLLQGPAQRAVNFIQSAQATDGSWGYAANTNGDTSIVGWQIQALHSAKLCKDLVVDRRTLERARKFLDSVSSGSSKSRYGYRTAADPEPTRTAVGLLCRYYMDGWGPNNPGMVAGVAYLMKSKQPDRSMEMYYYYYATQVLHFFEGPEWYKEWNPKMRDLLIETQVPEGKKDAGSWDPMGDHWIGSHCGRVGMTSMALLTLEVYYRHLPTYKRGDGGLRELERVK
jgi:hypothetical protein